MRVDVGDMPGVIVLTTRAFTDDRGSLLQAWVASDLEATGISARFEQAIQTRSRLGALRGLHFQWDPPMGKFLRCISGRIFDVVVDVRHDSAMLGNHAAVELSEENRKAIWIPPGLAHGMLALEEGTIVLYECTAAYNPAAEGGIRWDDPKLGIAWPNVPAIVSEKDRAAPTLAEWLADPRSQGFRFS